MNSRYVSTLKSTCVGKVHGFSVGGTYRKVLQGTFEAPTACRRCGGKVKQHTLGSCLGCKCVPLRSDMPRTFRAYRRISHALRCTCSSFMLTRILRGLRASSSCFPSPRGAKLCSALVVHTQCCHGMVGPDAKCTRNECTSKDFLASTNGTFSFAHFVARKTPYRCA